MSGKEYFEKYKCNPYFVFIKDEEHDEGAYYDKNALVEMDREDYDYLMEEGIACDDDKNMITE